MIKLNLSLIVLSGLLLTAGPLSSQEVHTDYDHGTDFSHYKTYSWVKVSTSNSIWDARVKTAVNSALTAKGLTEMPSGGDLAVTASRTSQDKQTLETFYDGLGGGWGWRRFGGGGGFGDATTTTDTYKVGTLVVDLFDSSSKSLRGEHPRAEYYPATPRRTPKTSTKLCRRCLTTFHRNRSSIDFVKSKRDGG